METVKILIADDYDLILNGIKDMLKPVKKYKIVGQATNGEEAVKKSLELKPDVIFMDISMPLLNGIQATRIITEQLPGVKVLALTQHEENEYVMQILKSGGCGYLLKNSKKEEFIAAIEAVIKGERYFSQKISDQMINSLMDQGPDRQEEEEEEVHLTKREKEIIIKIADDMSNQQIADELNISLRTVETHRRNIMQKLNVNTVVSLLKYAAQHQIITFD